MRPALRRFLVTGPAALAVAILASPAFAEVARRTVEHSVPAGDGLVKIANLAGRIDLVPAASGPVKVVATVHAEGDSAEETRRLLEAMRWVQESDGTWNLAWPVDRYDSFAYTAEGYGMWGGSSNGRFRGERVRVYGRTSWGAPVLYADLSITVPRGIRLDVSNLVGDVRGNHLAVATLRVDTGSGDVDLDGVDGALTVDTGSGEIALSQVRGAIVADTGSGDVKIDGIEAPTLKVDTGSGDIWVAHGTAGEVLADTGSGDIELAEVRLHTFDGDTGSGDVTVAGGLAEATAVRVDTGSGGVRLLGGEGFEFDLVTDVGSGDVRVGYGDARLDRDDGEVVGARRGSGRTRVVVGTGSGDVVVAPLGH